MADGAWETWLENAAMARVDADLQRALTTYKRIDARSLHYEGNEFLSFLSNDYLGFATHPWMISAASKAAEYHGVGASASRLISGTSPEHAKLEDDLAAFMGTEAALVFSSGYHANLGLLSALGDADTLILSDSLNHASIIDGARLSRAQVEVFRHRDYAHAEEIALKHHDKRMLIVSDGLFSIDGDLSNWTQLSALAERVDALLLVDDAHGFGVLGESGRGSIEAASQKWDQRILCVGTFSKAAGSSGGFVACSQAIKDFLLNSARSFIFSTAPSVPCVSAARKAIFMFQEEQGRDARTRVLTLAQRLREGLINAGFDCGGAAQIVPLWLGEPQKALSLRSTLLESGIAAAAIRPPTVPKGRAMLRFSVSAAHHESDIDRLVKALGKATT